MRKLLTPLAISCLLFSVPAPAVAQLGTGVSGYSSAPLEGSNRDYWYMIRQLGYCLPVRKSEESLAFLATEPGSREESKAWKKLFSSRVRNPCMQNFVRASIVRGHVRGSIAEALFLRKMKSGKPIASFNTKSPVVVNNIYDFGQCYVANHFKKAHAMLSETKVATKGELQFVKEIAVDFGPCLPAGRDVRVDPTNVRYALAEALYKSTLQTSPSSSQDADEEARFVACLDEKAPEMIQSLRDAPSEEAFENRLKSALEVCPADEETMSMGRLFRELNARRQDDPDA